MSNAAPNLLCYERQAWAEGHARVAGVDEVGRGPLAGSVVAVAVVLPEAAFRLPLDDSKKLTARQRETLACELRALPGILIGLGQTDAAEIDRVNILRATHAAMRRALAQLAPPPHFALVDGRPVPGLGFPARFVVKGDSRSASMAAASILAKVYRDTQMEAFDELYPGYGFARHKGYGTAAHLDALRRLGPCPIHRHSFAPVRCCDNPFGVQLEFGLGSETPTGVDGGNADTTADTTGHSQDHWRAC